MPSFPSTSSAPPLPTHRRRYLMANWSGDNDAFQIKCDEQEYNLQEALQMAFDLGQLQEYDALGVQEVWQCPLDRALPALPRLHIDSSPLGILPRPPVPAGPLPRINVKGANIAKLKGMLEDGCQHQATVLKAGKAAQKLHKKSRKCRGERTKVSLAGLTTFEGACQWLHDLETVITASHVEYKASGKRFSEELRSNLRALPDYIKMTEGMMKRLMNRHLLLQEKLQEKLIQENLIREKSKQEESKQEITKTASATPRGVRKGKAKLNVKRKAPSPEPEEEENEESEEGEELGPQIGPLALQEEPRHSRNPVVRSEETGNLKRKASTPPSPSTATMTATTTGEFEDRPTKKQRLDKEDQVIEEPRAVDTIVEPFSSSWRDKNRDWTRKEKAGSINSTALLHCYSHDDYHYGCRSRRSSSKETENRRGAVSDGGAESCGSKCRALCAFYGCKHGDGTGEEKAKGPNKTRR